MGSVLCLRVLDLMPAESVEVRHVGDLPSKPTWLTGTPTLQTGGEVLRGHQALGHLQRLAVQRAPATRREPRDVRRGGPFADRDVHALDDDGLPDAAAWTASLRRECRTATTTTPTTTDDDLARAVQARASAAWTSGWRIFDLGRRCSRRQVDDDDDADYDRKITRQRDSELVGRAPCRRVACAPTGGGGWDGSRGVLSYFGV